VRPATSSTAGDSAGQPWAGRTLPPGGFGGDDGSADAGVVDALQRAASGVVGAADVVAALATARVMVAVVAVLGEGAEQTSVSGDKQADMALVTITGPDGRRALPVFSSPITLAAWDRSARPVPVGTQRAAHAALAEGCERLVLDVAGPTPFLASRSALVALAQGRVWVPAHEDHVVGERLDLLVAGESDVVGVGRRPGTAAELRVELSVRPGLTREQLSDLVSRVGERLTSDEVLRERADGLELAVVPGWSDGLS
jgi:hypothetical protein